MKFASRIFLPAVLLAGWVLPTHGATISFIGTHLDAEGGLADTNAGWRIGTQAKPLDIDGDNIYGTAGYRLVAPYTVTPVTAATTRVSLPVYVKTVTVAQPSGSFNSGYALINDPQNPGAFIRSGTCYVNDVPVGTNELHMTFTLGGKVPDTFRVGLLLDNADGNDVPLLITVTQTAGTAAGLAQASTAAGNRKPDWAFFDIQGGQSNDAFAITLAPATNVGATRLGGLVWDSLPPATPLLSTTGGASQVKATSATLNGYLAWTGASPTRVSAYWGLADGGTNASAWEHTTDIGPLPIGPLSVPVSGLADGAMYYYTFHATNDAGEAWAPSAATFVTPLNVAGYAFKMKITFPGYARDEALTNFPALVVLGPDATPSGFSYSQFASTNGFDLRFQDGTETRVLDHEVERWSTASNSLVWVNVPLLASNTCIWAYWGNPAVAAAPPVFATNGSTWANGYAAVWHLDEAVGAAPQDSSINRFTGTLGGGVTQAVAGVVGSACAFNGTDAFIRKTNTDLGTVGTVALSCWVNVARNPGPNLGLLSANAAAGQDWASGLALTMAGGSADFSHLTVDELGGSTGNLMLTNFPFGTWHYIAAVSEPTGASGVRLYVDGAFQTNANRGAGTTLSLDEIRLGCRYEGAPVEEEFFPGQLDEVRYETASRSANWIWATWATMASNAAFTSLGPVSKTGGPQTILSIY